MTEVPPPEKLSREEWERRYLALVPEFVDAAFVKEWLLLWQADPVRMLSALHDFVLNSESDETGIFLGPHDYEGVRGGQCGLCGLPEGHVVHSGEEAE